MNSLSSKFLRAATLALAIPALGLCANVGISFGNVNVCVNGINCTSPTPVTYGNTQTGTTSNGFTVNNDNFSLTSNYSLSYGASGSYIVFNPVGTYLGGTIPSAGTSFTVDMYGSIYDNGPGSFDGTYNEHVILSVGVGTLAEANLFVDGQGIGLVGGPAGDPAGNYDVHNSANLTGLNGNYLNYDYRFIFNFLPSATVGTCDSGDPNVLCYGSNSPVPEPAQTIPAALSLAGFALVALRRRKQ